MTASDWPERSRDDGGIRGLARRASFFAFPPAPPVPAAKRPVNHLAMTLFATSDAPAAPPHSELPVSRLARGLARRLAVACGRALLPLLALATIASTLWLGPWFACGIAFALWRAAGRYA